MTSAIFSLLPVRRSSTIASIRIGCWLSDHLGIPLLDDSKILDLGTLDNLFIINGSTLYCKFLPEIAEIIREARNVVWIQNDYTLPPPKSESGAQSPFRRAFADRKLVPHYWTTCEENKDKTKASGWVNWNSLAFKMDAPRTDLESRHTIYYGAYREDRAAAFIQMYTMAEELSLHISSTSAKFPDNLRIDPFREDLYKSLSTYGMGIYAQDAKSRYRSHSPATRFYEMLSVGLPMVFTPDCVRTLSQYGYDVSKYVLAPGVQTRRRTMAQEQARWAEDFESKVKGKVNELTCLLD